MFKDVIRKDFSSVIVCVDIERKKHNERLGSGVGEGHCCSTNDASPFPPHHSSTGFGSSGRSSRYRAGPITGRAHTAVAGGPLQPLRCMSSDMGSHIWWVVHRNIPGQKMRKSHIHACDTTRNILTV